MNFFEKQPFRIAILDLYEGLENQGMRCLREIVLSFGIAHNLDVTLHEFDVRLQNKVPDMSYDVYISSGGPGSPLATKGSKWESHYFSWLNAVEKWNEDEGNVQKKYVFFICHSFQLVCRYWELATVCERKSTSFGVFPIHMLEDAHDELVFNGMADPFYAVDSRDFQVIEPRMNILYKGAKILCIEKDRPQSNMKELLWECALMNILLAHNFIRKPIRLV